MLPAISADLPAALIPPSGKATGQTTTDEAGFGPTTRVEFSTEQAIKGQSSEPGNSLYGPDGQFVENAGRRELPQTRFDDSPTPPVNENPSVEREPRPVKNDRDAAAVAPEDAVVTSAQDRASRRAAETKPIAQAEVREESRTRNLDLADFDAVVPPAAREELIALADRVNKKATNHPLTSKDYKLITDLMTRIGRFREAHDALDKARELEEAGNGPARDVKGDVNPESSGGTPSVAEALGAA